MTRGPSSVHECGHDPPTTSRRSRKFCIYPTFSVRKKKEGDAVMAGNDATRDVVVSGRIRLEQRRGASWLCTLGSSCCMSLWACCSQTRGNPASRKASRQVTCCYHAGAACRPEAPSACSNSSFGRRVKGCWFNRWEGGKGENWSGVRVEAMERRKMVASRIGWRVMMMLGVHILVDLRLVWFTGFLLSMTPRCISKFWYNTLILVRICLAFQVPNRFGYWLA